MVDLQRKTECVSWADEPSPYSSPIPVQPPLFRPSSPLFHSLVPFCEWSGWRPHTTRGSLTCTMHMSTSPSSWWCGGQASTLERSKRLITMSSTPYTLHNNQHIFKWENTSSTSENTEVSEPRCATTKILAQSVTIGRRKEAFDSWLCSISTRGAMPQQKGNKGRMGDGLEKPGGEDCGSSDGLCQGLGGIPSLPSSSKSSNPNPQFSESPFGTVLYCTVKHFPCATACVLYNCNAQNTFSFPPDYLIISHILLYQKETALLVVIWCSSTTQ